MQSSMNAGSTLPLHNLTGTLVSQHPISPGRPPSVNEVQSTSATASADATSTLQPAPTGYPKFAELMGHVPEMAAVRRFGALNAQNLLYLQAELMDIEKKLRNCQVVDNESGNEVKLYYARNWYFLSQSPQDNGEGEQLMLVNLAREKLEKYNAALIQQSQIAKLQPPGSFDLGFLQRYLASPEMGPYALSGVDSDVWGSVVDPLGRSSDLVAILPRHNEDSFSRWVTEKGVTKLYRLGLHKLLPVSTVHGMAGLEDATMLRLTYLLTTALASLLPIASIVVLYSVQSIKTRFLIMGAVNIVISCCLAAFTKARRAEVFGVAAAISAVQVVFVQVDSDECSSACISA